MKTLKWFRVGEPIPDKAKYLSQIRMVTEEKHDSDTEGEYTYYEEHREFLYEIPEVENEDQ